MPELNVKMRMNLFDKRLLFGLLITLLSFSELNAQLLNVERVRVDEDTTGWHGNLGFDFSLSRYIDHVIKISNSANASYNSRQHTYMFITSLEFVNLDGSALISSGYYHLRGTFLRNSTVSPELFTQYQYNNNLGLRNRALGGGGVRIEVINRENFSGNISTGLMYEYEDWGVSSEEAVQKELLKSTSNIAFTGNLSQNTTLNLTGYYQARPDRFFKPRAILESRLNVRMSRFISLSVSFTMQHDAEPIIDIPRLTYELKNGLLITF